MRHKELTKFYITGVKDWDFSSLLNSAKLEIQYLFLVENYAAHSKILHDTEYLWG